MSFYKAKRTVIIQLASLFSLRERLSTVRSTLNMPLKEQTAFVKESISLKSKSACEKSLTAIQTDLLGIEQEIDLLIANDERLSYLFKIITSVKCIGRITAIQVILSTNEFLDISNPKKFAYYSGVAPFAKESGIKSGKAKVSHIANKKVKALLHICALSAIQTDKELKSYFQRKTKVDGKPALLVVNAIRNKLILRIFACVNQNRMFETDYIRTENLRHYLSIN